jgi:hypothetical protein
VRGPARRWFVFPALTVVQETLDRDAMFARVFARFAALDDGGAPAATIPVARAVRLLAELLGGDADAAAAATEAARAAVLLQPGPRTKTALTRPEFQALFRAGTARMSAGSLYLAADEAFGIVPLSAPALASLCELFDRVVAARPERNAFTAAGLAELAAEIGFGADEAAAAACLAASAAAGSRGAGGGGGSGGIAATVALRRDEFVDFMASRAAAGGIQEARMADYLRVFYMLHLSGIREQAGVPAVGTAASH